MNQSFKKAARLATSTQFEWVFGRGERRQDRFFVLILAPNTCHQPRLGLAISKRRARRAVDRNRIKRIIRESFRTRAKQLPAVDIIVLARQATATADKRQLHASLASHWQALSQTPQGTTQNG